MNMMMMMMILIIAGCSAASAHRPATYTWLISDWAHF